MQYSKVMHEIAKILLIVLLIMIAENFATKYMVSMSWSPLFNHDVKVIEDDNENVEMVIVGASRGIRTYMPYIIEEELGFDNVINASTSSQTATGTYYMGKDMVDRFHPKYMVVAVTFEMLIEESSLMPDLIVKDRVSKKTLVSMVPDCFAKEPLYLMNLYRFRDGALGYWKRNNENMTKVKLGIPIDLDDDTYYYAGKGAVYSYVECDNGGFRAKHLSFSRDDVKKKNMNYINKLVKYCKKNGTTVIFSTGVTSISRILSNSGYQQAVDFYKEYCEENGIIYYNLNYIKDREKILPDTKMMDDNHLNGEGAEIASKIFSRAVAIDFEGEYGNKEDIFYKDLEELKADINRISGVGADIKREGSFTYIDTYATRGSNVQNVEYRIYGIGKNGAKQLLSDFSEQDYYRFQFEDSSINSIRVEAKQKQGIEVEAYYETEIIY